MCGRYTHTTTDAQTLTAAFSLFEPPPSDIPARYNIAPTQLIATVVQEEVDQNILRWMYWGLVPSWAKDDSGASKLINARAETLGEKPSFRNAYRQRRCLIIADGFYEWKTKTPMYVRLKDQSVFGMAGLWERWTHPETGEIKTTCTIITTTPNDLIAPLHHRMAVILPREVYSQWLNPMINDTEVLQNLLVPYPADLMETYAVSSRVNNVNYDRPDLIERIGTNQPSLF